MNGCRRTRPQLATLVASLLLTACCAGRVAAGWCPSAPLTGCTQSTQVSLSASNWTWTNDGEDYTLSTSGFEDDDDKESALLPVPNNGVGSKYALCIYDGSLALATDFVTPNGNNVSLLFDSSTTSGGLVLSSSQPGSVTASFNWPAASSLSGTQRAVTIAQLITKNGKSCWARAVSIKPPPSNTPDMPPGVPLNLAAGLSLLNSLAARYNANAQRGPLNLVAWLAGMAPTAILSGLLGKLEGPTDGPTGPADILPALSALHLAGFWGGAWFQRDGFSGQMPFFAAPASTTAPAYGAALFVPFQQLPVLQGYVSNILAISTSDPNGYTGAAGSFGYNAGYSQLLLAFGSGKGPLYAPRAGLSLTCELSKLFACNVQPRTIKALTQLSGAVKAWNDSLPASSTALADAVAIQQGQAAKAQALWGGQSPVGLPLVSFVKPEPPLLWQTLYQVNNLFLEALQLAGRLLVRGLALVNDPDQGKAVEALKDAALVQAAVSAWLASYGVGLGAAPLLPQFDLGTTPLV